MYQVLFATPDGWSRALSMQLSDLMPTVLFSRDWSLYRFALDLDEPFTYSWKLIGCSARYYMGGC